MLNATRYLPAGLLISLLVLGCAGDSGAPGPVTEAPTITTASLADGMVGMSYSEALTATGGIAPYTWSLSFGALPQGLALDASGLISGIPTADGFTTFTLKVTASDGLSASKPMTIDIAPDIYAPGTEWGGGDWPTLVAPALSQDVIIGDPVPRVTVPYDGDFQPLLNAVQGQGWHLRITRPETLCDTRVSKYPTGLHWSYALPTFTYFFDPCFGYYDSELKDFDVSWPLTINYRLLLMQNGFWLTGDLYLPRYWYIGGNSYYVDRWFKLPAQPDLHLSMVHAWVVREGADGDRIFVEGPVTIEHQVVSGVNLSSTETFTTTTAWSAGIDVKGISASLSQTFERSSSHTVSLDTESTTTETKYYDVATNERWRFIQLYGVDRYLFTDVDGNSWTSPYLVPKSLGSVDNKVRNVLMIVKYRGGSSTPFAVEVIEDAAIAPR